MASKKKTAKKTAKKKAAKTAPTRRTKNGVREPAPGTLSARLWELCDKLKAKLHRAPARFEFRAAVAELKEPVHPDSASMQYFNWRKHHGIPGHATGLYPKQNTFEPSARSRSNGAPRAKKAAKKAAKKSPKSKKAKKSASRASGKNSTAKRAKAAKNNAGKKRNTASTKKTTKKRARKSSATTSAPIIPISAAVTE